MDHVFGNRLASLLIAMDAVITQSEIGETHDGRRGRATTQNLAFKAIEKSYLFEQVELPRNQTSNHVAPLTAPVGSLLITSYFGAPLLA